MALLFRLRNAVFSLRLFLSCCSDSSPDSSYSRQFCFTLFSSIWILLWSSLVFPSSCSSLLPQELDSLFAFALPSTVFLVFSSFSYLLNLSERLLFVICCLSWLVLPSVLCSLGFSGPFEPPCLLFSFLLICSRQTVGRLLKKGRLSTALQGQFCVLSAPTGVTSFKWGKSYSTQAKKRMGSQASNMMQNAKDWCTFFHGFFPYLWYVIWGVHLFGPFLVWWLLTGRV